MRARKNFSYLALLSLQSAPIPRKGERPSLNLGDDSNFFAQFECAPLSSIIRRGVRRIACANVWSSCDEADGLPHPPSALVRERRACALLWPEEVTDGGRH